MAEHKLSGKQYALFIDSSGPDSTNYDTLVCLTSKDWASSVNIIDASSDCGADSLPGTPAPDVVNFEGQHLFDQAAGKISGQGLFPLIKAGTIFSWKIAPVTPQEGDEILSGNGFISELSKNYATDEAVTFSGAISVSGDTNQEIYNAS